MPFDNIYRIEKKSEESCILQIFGFKKEKRESSYLQSVYVSDDDTLSGKRKVTRSHSYEVHEWKRKNNPSGKELELENKFVEAIKKDDRFYSKDPLGRKVFDPLKTATVHTSLRDYYENWERALSGPSINYTRWVHIGIIVLFIAWFALYSFIFPVFEQIFGHDAGAAVYVFVAPIIFLLMYWGVFSFVSWREDIAYQKHQNPLPAYDFLSEKEIDDLRQRYFAYLERVYGKEAGEILGQYIQLKYRHKL